jgi:hypothetical protein
MSNIERNVMASVATVYTVRALLSRTALKLYVCAASLWGIGQLVWVSRVFENFQQAGNTLQFIAAAVLHTEIMVQLVLLVGGVAFISLFFDLFRPAPSRNFA